VVDDLIGASAQEQAVLGETTNLAARLQAIAEPGVVMIESSTRRFIANQHANADAKASATIARFWSSLHRRRRSGLDIP
jgi:class 3 adenylate cyclase